MHVKKQTFFKQLLALMILGVFSLAITPWGALHHHESETVAHEKHCTHTVHVKTSAETCLICKAHFEKNFTTDFQNYLVYLKSEPVKAVFPLVGNSFTDIIASCLRGPPSFS